MPYPNHIPTSKSSAADPLQNTVRALQAEVRRLEQLRDTAVFQATNEQAAELVRVALQKDVDLAQRQLEQAEEQLSTIPGE
jgi:hypothetical protein